MVGMKTYTVRYERDESGHWIATVRGVRGCHSYGRTLDEARRRVREALGLFVNDADEARLVDKVKLPARVKRLLARVQVTRTRAQAEQARAATAARAAVRTLTKDWRLSVRDAGQLLGLSHQRVHQLVAMRPASTASR